MKTATNLLCVLLLIAAGVLARWDRGPDGLSGVAGTAAAVPRVIAELQAGHYVEVAEQLRAGTIAGDIDSGNWLRERNKAAIDAAYKPLDELLQQTLGDGKWTDQLGAKFYEQIANGLRSAAERLH